MENHEAWNSIHGAGDGAAMKVQEVILRASIFLNGFYVRARLRHTVLFPSDDAARAWLAPDAALWASNEAPGLVHDRH
jgi:hypothetical protein